MASTTIVPLTFLTGVVSQEILARALEYWRNIDKAIGDKIEAATLEKRSAGVSEKGGARFD